MTTAPATVAPKEEALPTGPVAYTWDLPVLRNPSVTRRGVAFLVDSLVVLALTYLILLVLTATRLLYIPNFSLDGLAGNRTLGFFWLGLLLEGPVGLLYFTWMEGRSGQTLGKLLTGLRVRTLQGAQPGFFDAFLRNLLRLLWVTPFGPAFLLLDAYAVQTTELDQRIGDLAAKTTVVDEGEP